MWDDGVDGALLCSLLFSTHDDRAHGAAMLNIEGSSFFYLRRGWYFALAAWRPLAASVNARTCTS